jgi:NADH-ubiquinone oxidoreductase chain 5
MIIIYILVSEASKFLMCLIIVFLPLIGSIFSGLFGRYVGRFGSVLVTVFSMILSTVIAFFEFYSFSLNNDCFFICIGS